MRAVPELTKLPRSPVQGCCIRTLSGVTEKAAGSLSDGMAHILS